MADQRADHPVEARRRHRVRGRLVPLGAGFVHRKPQALRTLGTAMRGYYASTLAPAWPTIRARVATGHTRLAGILTARGIRIPETRTVG
ncbi:hypothetical protein ACPZ19_49920 [Amycolatopsis lurida]